MRKLEFAILVLAVIAVTGVEARAQYRMTTEVTDFVTTKWEIECPDGKIDMSEIDIVPEGWAELFACISDIESTNGLALESKTRVKNGVVESDRIESEVEMTEEQARKLCDLIEKWKAPPVPAVFSRPRIRSELVDGVLTSTTVVFPDGKTLDLSLAALDPTTLQGLLNLLNQFETENGVHVTGQTTVVDNQVEVDRILSVTYLTAGQLQQVLQFLMNQGYQVDPGGAVLPIMLDVQLQGMDQKFKTTLSGTMGIREMGAPDQDGVIPVEIVSLSLSGDAGGHSIQIGLPIGEPGQGGLRPGPGGFQVDAFFDIPVEITIPDLAFSGVGRMPLMVAGSMKLPARRDHRFKARGAVPLVHRCEDELIISKSVAAEEWVVAELGVKGFGIGKTSHLMLVPAPLTAAK